MFRKLVFSEVSIRFLTVNGSQFTASDRCIVMCRNSILYGRLRIVFYDMGIVSIIIEIMTPIVLRWMVSLDLPLDFDATIYTLYVSTWWIQIIAAFLGT